MRTNSEYTLALRPMSPTRYSESILGIVGINKCGIPRARNRCRQHRLMHVSILFIGRNAGFGTSNGTPLHPQWLSTVTGVYVVGNWLAAHTDSPLWAFCSLAARSVCSEHGYSEKMMLKPDLYFGRSQRYR